MSKGTDRDIVEGWSRLLNLTSAILEDINHNLFYPYIVTDAEEQYKDVGETCTFSITAYNVTSYQWQYRNPETPLGTWIDISGATGSSYSFTVTSADYDNVYRVKMVGKVDSAIEYNRNVLMVFPAT